MGSVNNNNAAVILAGGTGSRFSDNINKSLALIENFQLWEYVLRQYLNLTFIDSIIIVTNDEITSVVREKILKQYQTENFAVKIVSGGPTRQLSCWAGLLALKASKPINVIFQEAARPIVHEDIIIKGLSLLERNPSALAVQKSRDGLLNVNNDFVIESIQSRNATVCGIGPEFFNYQKIIHAHEKALDDGIIDFPESCGLFSYYGGKVKCFLSNNPSIKVTYPYDLEIVKGILSAGAHEKL